jgi:hypothetical protein
MHLKQFFVEGLGHASYLIGSDRTGEAAVVDPRRDVDIYVQEAGRLGLRVRPSGKTGRPRAQKPVAAGRVKLKVLPLPRSLSTQIRPPWASTSIRAIYSPSPSPSALPTAPVL